MSQNTNTPAALAELIAKWRNRTAELTYLICADELEAALRSQPDAQAVAWQTPSGRLLHATHVEAFGRPERGMRPLIYGDVPHPASQPKERDAFIRGYKHGACGYIGGDNTEELHAAATWAADNQSDDAGVFPVHQPSGEAVAVRYAGSPVDDLRVNLAYLAELASKSDPKAALHFVTRIKEALQADRDARTRPAPQQPVSLPEGFVVVPREPTDVMYNAAFEISQYVAFDRFCRDWKQMLAAAPQPVAQKD